MASTLSDRVKEKMIELEFSSVDLADMLGVTPSSVHNWLEKNRVPGGKVLVADLARVLGASEHYLIYGGTNDRAQTFEPSLVELPVISLANGRTVKNVEVLRRDLDQADPLQCFVAYTSRPFLSLPRGTECIFCRTRSEKNSIALYRDGSSMLLRKAIATTGHVAGLVSYRARI